MDKKEISKQKAIKRSQENQKTVKKVQHGRQYPTKAMVKK